MRYSSRSERSVGTVSFRIGDLVTYSLVPLGEIGLVIGIEKYQMTYRVHGLKVLWGDNDLQLEHPSDLKMISRAACNEPTMMVESNYE
jgi:hypothetical protein